MEDREFEQMLERVLGQDFSAGTEDFRDALLKRCLAVLGQDGRAYELADDDLELIAAAGADYNLGGMAGQEGSPYPPAGV